MAHEREARIHDAARQRATELREQALDRAWRRLASFLVRAPRATRTPARPVQA